MPQISQKKKDKISEQILHFLFSTSPAASYTASIAQEIARDEEFTKVLLQELVSKSLIKEISKNPSGLSYTKRRRWALSSQAYEAYKKQQFSTQQSL